VAPDHLDGKSEITEGLLNHVEVAIRAYDPCLSCATHAMGQMPLKCRSRWYDHEGSCAAEPFRLRQAARTPAATRSAFQHAQRKSRRCAGAEQAVAVATPARRPFVLGIRGYEFNEFGEGLSEKAQANLAAAIEYMQQSIAAGRLEEVGTDGEEEGEETD
jgi:hypothetical protein